MPGQKWWFLSAGPIAGPTAGSSVVSPADPTGGRVQSWRASAAVGRSELTARAATCSPWNVFVGDRRRPFIYHSAAASAADVGWLVDAARAPLAALAERAAGAV